VIQPMLVTPILCIAMWKVALAGTRSGGGARVQWRYFGLVGGCRRWASSCWASSPMSSGSVSLAAAGLPGAAGGRAGGAQRLATLAARTGWWLAAAGTVLAFGYYLMASTPALREQMAGSKYYPRNFAGWQPLAVAVRDELRQMPPGTRVLAGNFKVGAELGFQLGNGDIEVLPHPLNDKHGRTAQLAQWGLLHEGPRSAPMLLVLSPSDQRYRDLLARYHAICEQVGPLPAPRVVSSDHGFQRFLLFRCRCSARAVRDAGNGWLDAPSNGEVVSERSRSRAGRSRMASGWRASKCWSMAVRSVMPATGARSTSATPGRTAPIRSIRRWASTHRWIPPRWRRAGTGWACACMAATAAWRVAGAAVRGSLRPLVREPSRCSAPSFRAPRNRLRSRPQSAISGRPTSAVGSRLSIASNRLMPRPSHLKLPAQSSGCSAAT
jgi:hypothetical protein